ncbi:hypothetical protein MA16_Dca026516 [Dendrobium catenatum]|uniref:Uncharacterized protein n=1 Tax=Dendrobium catenatum TaxID=906689 RepID=A0A2I0W2R7_9ASPA|nr:hypothetical protein MA16_Dca026516 [Dendrobium catenatum]
MLGLTPMYGQLRASAGWNEAGLNPFVFLSRVHTHEMGAEWNHTRVDRLVGLRSFYSGWMERT